MHFGISFFATDQTLDPVSVARAVEDRGFESLWLPEHSHIPTSRRTPWGGVPDAPPLPESYAHTYDSFVALGAAAAVTSRIKLATGITLLAQRDPIWTAKEVATLDHLSAGRLILGIGYGWNREEMESHGVSYPRRRTLVREKLQLMKALWTQDEASFQGELISLEPSWAWPKPIQTPHPPIVLGAAAGPRTVTDIVDLCDGWIPLGRHDHIAGAQSLRAALAEAGRPEDDIELTHFNAKPTVEFVEQMRDVGFSRLLFAIPSVAPDEVLRRLDERAEFVRNIAP